MRPSGRPGGVSAHSSSFARIFWNGTRGRRRERATSARVRSASAALFGLAALALAPRALAGPGDAEAQKGLAAAKKGDCVKAIPLLEEAELARHRPTSAVALADCYVATGELLGASQLYHAVAEEKAARGWLRADYNAQKAAGQKIFEVDARIPTLRFALADDYPELSIHVNGKAWHGDPTEEQKVPPDAAISVVVKARGRKELTARFVLAEGEHKVVTVRFDTPGGSAGSPGAAKGAASSKTPTSWVGAAYRGVIIPQFVMNFFGDGGRSMLAPGGGLTFTTTASDAEVWLSINYLDYNLPDTPFKSKGSPDADYEIISSDLQAVMANVDLLWSKSLDADGTWAFKFGGGVGVGWTFAGNLYRTQAYPPPTGNPPQYSPGNPYTYMKCIGPDNPPGSYRYCNELNRDKDLYNGYAEPNWFQGGVRPLIFPWLTFPELGLSWKVADAAMIDLTAGLSISGIWTSLGVRFGL
jgi:hypothetical protein